LLRAPLPPSRPVPPAPVPEASPGPDAALPSPSRASSACHARLALIGVTFSPAPATEPQIGCGIEEPVRLDGMLVDGDQVKWPDRPVVSCALAVTLAEFVRDAAVPLARGIVGRPLAAFGTGPGFACRPRNRVDGARISAHGRGIAVDIAWFAFADGRRESVEAPSGEPTARFINSLRRAACGWFTTVLGPGSDAAHADHLHLDRESRGQRGDSRLCQ